MALGMDSGTMLRAAQTLRNVEQVAARAAQAGPNPRWAELIQSARSLDRIASEAGALGASADDAAPLLDKLALGAAHHAREGAVRLQASLAEAVGAAPGHDLQGQLGRIVFDPQVDLHRDLGAFEGAVKRVDPKILDRMGRAFTPHVAEAVGRARSDGQRGAAIAERVAQQLAPNPGGLAHRPAI